MKLLNKQSGFTLVELMIATVVFSVILLGATTATIQIGRMYYKGIIASRTQETSRSIMDTISRPIQFAGSDVRASGMTTFSGIQIGALCVGDQRYTYAINAQVDETAAPGSYTNHKARHGLWQDTLNTTTSPCSALDLTQITPTDANTKGGTTGKDILGQNMRLARFNVGNNGNIWSINTLVIYGDDDLLLPDANAPTGCRAVAQSAQWCATSGLSTQVYKRINPDN